MSELNLPNELYEKLADIEHQRWSDWQKYMFSLCKKNIDGSLTIPVELVDRWTNQIHTDFPDLTEAEKDSDREQVDRYWGLIEDALSEARDEIALQTALAQSFKGITKMLQKEIAALEIDVYEWKENCKEQAECHHLISMGLDQYESWLEEENERLKAELKAREG